MVPESGVVFGLFVLCMLQIMSTPFPLSDAPLSLILSPLRYYQQISGSFVLHASRAATSDCCHPSTQNLDWLPYPERQSVQHPSFVGLRSLTCSELYYPFLQLFTCTKVLVPSWHGLTSNIATFVRMHLRQWRISVCSNVLHSFSPVLHL